MGLRVAPIAMAIQIRESDAQVGNRYAAGSSKVGCRVFRVRRVGRSKVRSGSWGMDGPELQGKVKADWWAP